MDKLDVYVAIDENGDMKPVAFIYPKGKAGEYASEDFLSKKVGRGLKIIEATITKNIT